MIYKDYIRVLHIDLENERIRIEERKDLKQYLGGVGVAAKLLEENMRPELNPLAPEQPVVFAIGALTTIAPVMTKTVAMFISPLTGELGESYGGGRMSLTMFEAGYDAIVLTGRAKKPIFLSISDDNVLFRDARPFWKTKNDNHAHYIIREYEKSHSGKRTIIRIGRAGENKVAYACVLVDRYRHFGRLGLGAVFGAKLLKAINLVGHTNIPIQKPKEYLKLYGELYEKSTAIGGPMAKYHDTGTPINVEPLNAAGGLPTLNLRQASFEHAERVSGEAFAQRHLVRKMSCTGCPVGCIHIGQFRRSFADHGHEYEIVPVGYDYELIFALGTFLGIDNSKQILELIEEVEVCAMDAMSTGVALGWATEALENGLINVEEHTLVPLKFGNAKEYCEAIHHIAVGKNDFYKALGKGVRYASEVYGGADYAMHIAGNEMPGYHTGYGSLAGVAIAARHSHLCNGGYSIDQAGGEPLSAEKMADALFKEEVERCMLNSLVMCLFARKVYDRETLIKAFKAIGEDYTNEDLSAIALRNYATKLRIKKALGFDWENIKIPKRFFETPSATGQLSEEGFNEVLRHYRNKIRELV